MEDYTIEVAGEKFDMSQGGLVQIQRLAKLTKFINIYGKSAIQSTVVASGANGVDIPSFIINFLGGLDEKGLILMGQVVTNKDDKFVTEHFDLAWVIDGISMLLSVPAFKKVQERFFGNQG